MKYVLILLMLTLIKFTLSVHQTTLESSCGTSGALTGAVLGEYADMTDLQCSRVCRDNLQCRFVRYQPETGNNASSCILLDDDVTCSGEASSSGSGTANYQLSARTAPAGWFYFHGAVYNVTSDKYTYYECLDVCVDHQAELTSITSAEEDEFIVTTLNRDIDLWLGGNDIALEGQWVWDNGEDLGYTNWCASGDQPDNYMGNENCMMMKPTSSYPFWKGWNDENCARKFQCVCKKYV